MSNKASAKPPMPAQLIPMADAALVRHRKRRFVPEMVQERGGWACPYATQDSDRWWALLFDVFGTRHTSSVGMFFEQLSALLESSWNADWQEWIVDGGRMVALLTMVQAMKPLNEAETALAAQLVALHLTSMKLAEGSLRYSGGDARSVAVLAKATRAYGDGLATMRRLQGKSQTSRQIIKVESHKHVHQHVHLNGEGAENGGQPHATAGAGLIEASATVPGQNAGGEVVPFTRCEKQARLPDARGGKSRRSEG